jgi:hypothetical protein
MSLRDGSLSLNGIRRFALLELGARPSNLADMNRWLEPPARHTASPMNWRHDPLLAVLLNRALGRADQARAGKGAFCSSSRSTRRARQAWTGVGYLWEGLRGKET